MFFVEIGYSSRASKMTPLSNPQPPGPLSGRWRPWQLINGRLEFLVHKSQSDWDVRERCTTGSHASQPTSCRWSWTVLGQGVIAHKHEADVEVRVRLFDCEHLATIARLKEAFRFDDHAVGEEEVRRVLRFGDVVELLDLIEVRAVGLVEEFRRLVPPGQSGSSYRVSPYREVVDPRS